MNAHSTITAAPAGASDPASPRRADHADFEARVVHAVRELETLVHEAMMSVDIADTIIDGILDTRHATPKGEHHLTFLLSKQELEQVAFVMGRAQQTVTALNRLFLQAIEGKVSPVAMLDTWSRFATEVES